MHGYDFYPAPTHHGLSVYVRDNLKFRKITLEATDLQIMAIVITTSHGPLVHMALYRHASLPVASFKTTLQTHLSVFSKSDIIIVGDFNNVDTGFLPTLKHYQYIHKPTHHLGGILDLIYINMAPERVVSVGTFPLSFTDHFITLISKFK